MSAVQVKFYDAVEDRLLKFAAILARADGGRMFCRHKQRDTWEIPGGRREAGESIPDTARRELAEETGALDFTIKPVCADSVTGAARVNAGGEECFGRLYSAEVHSFAPELHSGMERILLTDELPAAWTYPLIRPPLLREAVRRGLA